MKTLIKNARREALHVLTNGRAYKKGWPGVRPSYIRLCRRFLRQWGTA